MSGVTKSVERFVAPVILLVRLHLLAIGIVAGLVLLYALAGFFLVPRLARSQLESYVAEQLHRQVTVGEIRFNPFFFDTSIAGLTLREADGSTVVAFRHLYVNAELASLWQRAVVLKEVELSAPNIEMIVARDGTVNLAKLAPPESEPKQKAPAEEQTPPPRVRIGRLDVREGRIGFTDQTHEQPFTAAVTPIKFTLTDFKTDVDYQNAYDFSGATLAGEQLHWNGTFTVQPLGSSGQFGIQGLKAATIDAYAADALPFQMASGTASFSGSYRFAMSPTLALEVGVPSLQVRDFSMKERGAASAPIKLPEIDLHDMALSYEQRDVGVKQVDVKGAHIDVAREQDGSIDLMRLFAQATPEGESTPQQAQATEQHVQTDKSSSPPSPAESTPPQSQPAEWRVHVDKLQLNEATVLAEDRSVTPVAKFALSPIALTLDSWSTDKNAKVQLDANVTINEKGKLTGKGELLMDPLGMQLAVELNDFGLPAIQPYLNAETAMTLHSGQLGLKGDVSYAETKPDAPSLKFKGEVNVADLRTTDELVNQDFIKWRSLAITGIDFSQNPDKLDIDRVVARQLYGKVVIAQDRTLNVTKVLNPQSTQSSGESGTDGRTGARAVQTDNAAEESGTDVRNGNRPVQTDDATETKSFPIRVKSIRFIDGSANFADYSIEPSFASGILELHGAITGLSSNPKTRAKVKLEGKVDKYAPVDIVGDVNLLSATVYTDVALNFRNMELTTFNPYSGKFAGYNISKGKLSTELKYLVQDRKLAASHHIVIDNLEFGDKTDSKDAAPIPLKLAVALLKDRHGIMDLNLPVSGTLDDPKFRLGPIIWKAVLNLLTKVVTAPFAALGSLFGGGEELAFVDFEAGSAELPVAQTTKLNTLAKALVERPQLKLNVPLTVVTSQDSEALARAALMQKLPSGTPEQPAQRLAALEKVYQEVAKSAPEYPEETRTKDGVDVDARLKFLERSLLELLRPTDAALTALAQQRARSVQDAVLANTELNPERVFIVAERSEGKAESHLVRMELKLE